MTAFKYLLFLAMLVATIDGLTTRNPASYGTGSAMPPAVNRLASNWRIQMFDLVNMERQKRGKSALVFDYRLNTAAQKHSDYQFSAGIMTHSDPSGSLGERAGTAGISWRGVAENVAYNQQSIDGVIATWIHSPAHLSNILGNFDIVGFGEHGQYWTQMFARI